jgi:hypothetical protein
MEGPAIKENSIRSRAAAQELGEIASNRAIHCIRKRPFSQSNLRPGGPHVRLALGKESIEYDRLNLGPRDLAGECAAEQTRTPSGNRYREDVVGRIGEASFLQVAAARYEEIPLRCGKRVVSQARFDVVREREVDIVASEKKMIADRNSFDVREGRSGLAANLEQTEVGRAPADVDNDDVMYLACRKLSPKFARFAVVLQPAVKCGLRFL